MSGLGAALSGLVGGYQQGHNTRNAWDDRKLENERKKRKDEILDAQERRAEEAHGMGMTSTGLLNDARRQALRIGERDWGDSEDLRRAAQADVALVDAGIGPMGSMPPGAEGAVSSRPLISGSDPALIAAATQPAGSVIRPPAMGAMPPATSQTAMPPMGAVRPVAGGEWGRLGQSMPGASMEQVAAGGVAGAVAGMPMGSTPDGGAYVNEHGQQIVGGVAIPPAQALNPDGSYAMPAQKKERRTLAKDAGAVRDAVLGSGSRMVEQAGNQGIDLANALSAPSRWFRGYVFGDEPGTPGQKPLARADLNRDGITETVASPFFDAARPAKETPEQAKTALAKETGKGQQAPAQQEMAEGAIGAVEAMASNPSTKALAEGVARQALGSTPGRPMTDAQMDRGTKQFMKDFRATGAPNMIRTLLERGDIAGAQSLETFLRSDEAQKGIELWMKGSIQAMTGDVAGAAETFIETFNTPGYYDDGYEILRDQSEIIKDKAGRPIGASLMFRNQATGETFKRDMDPEEMGQMQAMLVSPDQAWAAQRERAKALQDALIEQQAKQDARAFELIKKSHATEEGAATKLFESSLDPLSGGAPIDMQEARRRAMGSMPIEGLDDGAVPRLQRPR